MNPPVQSAPQRLPLLDEALLEPRFSRLVCDLEIARGAAANLRGRQGDPQHGVDIESVGRNGGEEWSAGIQCKHSQSFAPADFLKELGRLEGFPRSLDEYRIVLACDASTSVRDLAKKQCGRARTCTGTVRVVDVVDASDLNRMLRDQPQIVEDYFGEDWRRAFCVGRDATTSPAPHFRHFPSMESPKGYPTTWVIELHGHLLGQHPGRAQVALRQASFGLARHGSAALCVASGRCEVADARIPVYRFRSAGGGQYQRWMEVGLTANVLSFASHLVDTNERNFRLLNLEMLCADLAIFLKVHSEASRILGVQPTASQLRLLVRDVGGLTLMAPVDWVYTLVPLRGLSSDATWTVVDVPVSKTISAALVDALDTLVGHFVASDLGLQGAHEHLAVLKRESAMALMEKVYALAP